MSRFKLGEELGRGSFGVVYKAIDTLTGRVVAIKVLHPEAGIPKRELEINSILTHKYICRTFEYFVNEAGQSCIVMEFADGGNLRKFIEQKHRPLGQSLSIARQILEALEHAHAQGIVHRDLKPENILLTRNGTVKITDFGTARFIGAPRSPHSRGLQGTPAYMAPEQLMGLDCDARTDLYAFGCILHEMVPTPSQPTNVRAVVDKCLQRDPSLRFAEADEARRALRFPLMALRKTATPAAVILAIALVAFVILGNRSSKPALLDPTTPLNLASIQPEAPIASSGARAIKRVAILDFENLTGDSALDPYAAGISETLRTELAQSAGVTILERSLVKEAASDLLVTGSLQKMGDKVRIAARVANAASGDVVGTPALVDGTAKDLFKLQKDLATQLAAFWGTGVHTRPPKSSVTEIPVPDSAFQAFSSGLYFLGKELTKDALGKFDLAVKIEPEYREAQHYRGVALAKLNRLDDAIDAFKSALPQRESEHLVKWDWDAGFTGPDHYAIRAIDTAEIHQQLAVVSGRKEFNAGRQIIYAERHGKTVAFQFIDFEQHTAHKLELQDADFPFKYTGFSNGTWTLVPSHRLNPNGSLRAGLVYIFSRDGSLLWQMEITDYGGVSPIINILDDTISIYYPALHRLDLYDARTGNLMWRRDALTIADLEAPYLRRTKNYGDILIVKSNGVYRALRKSDGKDVWTVDVQSTRPSELATDHALIVFEPERRIFAVDLETGRTTASIEIEQDVNVLASAGGKSLVDALVDGNTLYVVSKSLDLYAIDWTKGRTLWKTPLHKNARAMRVYGDRLYAGTEKGELIVLDRRSGRVITETALSPDAEVLIDYIGDEGVVAQSGPRIFGLSLAGMKNWEGPVIPKADVLYSKGSVVMYTSSVQVAEIDIATGSVLWRYAADAEMPYIMAAKDGVFILDEHGVKEYQPPSQPASITEKNTLTELARVYLAKRDVTQARTFASKAAEVDPDYPPLSLVRAQLLKAQGRNGDAGRELARYASMVGLDSKEGQRTIAEVKRDYGLEWEMPVGANVAGDPLVVGERVVSVGRTVDP